MHSAIPTAQDVSVTQHHTAFINVTSDNDWPHRVEYGEISILCLIDKLRIYSAFLNPFTKPSLLYLL